MMKRILPLLALVLLSGCASHGGFRYVERSSVAGDYYYDRGPVRGGYHGFGVGYYGYPFDLVYWHYPFYYSLFWGFRHYYHDPFFFPGFYYGVTWYPRTWFSFSVGYHDWGYYHAYAPWRHSFWGSYYTWYHAPRTPREGRYQRVISRHFGSARNEAERLASLNAQASTGLRSAPPSDKSRAALSGLRGPHPSRHHDRTGSTGWADPGLSGGRAPTGRLRSPPAHGGETPARGGRTDQTPRPERRIEPMPTRVLPRATWRAEPRFGSADLGPSGSGTRRALPSGERITMPAWRPEAGPNPERRPAPDIGTAFRPTDTVTFPTAPARLAPAPPRAHPEAQGGAWRPDPALSPARLAPPPSAPAPAHAPAPARSTPPESGTRRSRGEQVGRFQRD
jgi:hypothetical protein